MDEDKAVAIANALEGLHLNQIALRASLEELSTWVRQRGSVNTHENVMGALQSLDTNADSITSAIERLRS